ncbi:hypothetical protein Ddye_004726 [Dipteronia dyeriana]|uniref:Uncharacterized protein n=1 Tax=Dipteronia dyeriana TaxID=168575 RepID=A0AAD9XFQ4_9ROSI|nr:hypothetical protein Ddye_004726 [Dipteronia dyeriana]
MGKIYTLERWRDNIKVLGYRHPSIRVLNRRYANTKLPWYLVVSRDMNVDPLPDSDVEVFGRRRARCLEMGRSRPVFSGLVALFCRGHTSMDSNDINNFEFGSESMEEEYDGETQVPSNDDTGKGKKVMQSKSSRKRKETSKVWKWTWIKRLTEYLCDDINLVSRNTAKADVMRLFSREKQKIKTMLENTPELSDNNFKHCPSSSEWEKVKKINIFLQYFYDLTCVFSGTKYPISNLFFPKVFSTYMLLKQNKESNDVFLQKMVTQMYNKYYNYWDEFSVILAIALILDPRYKMIFIEFAYKKVYGINSPELENVRNKLLSLFNEYMSTSMSTRASTSLPSASGGDDTNISICEVTSESAFSVGGRVLDRYQSLLKTDVVEAIVCTRDWMQMDNVSESLEVEEICEDILNLTIEDSLDPSTESSQLGD